MKKKLVFSSVLFVLIIMLIWLFYPKSIYISYVPYESEYLYPRGIADVSNNPKEYKIKNVDYFSLYNKIKDLEEIREIEIDNTSLELDFIYTESGIITLDSMENDNENSTVEKRELTDRDIDVRYCICFPGRKKINQLSLGCNDKMIMIDNKFYKIQRNKHKELILFFSRIVDDEMDEDSFLFNEVLF